MFGFKMSAIDQKDVAFRHEKVMIFDVGGEIGVSMVFHGIAHERTSRATTQRHFLDFATCQGGMAQTRRTDLLCHKTQEISFFHRGIKLTYHARTAHFWFVNRRLQKMKILQSQAFRQHSAYTQVAVVQVGVHANHGDVVLDGLHHSAFDVGLWCEMLQTMENQGMVADNHIAVFGDECTWIFKRLCMLNSIF